MEANQMFDNRAYPTILPCDTWDQYEQLRLERIQQQRKRVFFYPYFLDGKHERCRRSILPHNN